MTATASRGEPESQLTAIAAATNLPFAGVAFRSDLVRSSEAAELEERGPAQQWAEQEWNLDRRFPRPHREA